jgi:hypothetical protein
MIRESFSRGHDFEVRHSDFLVVRGEHSRVGDSESGKPNFLVIHDSRACRGDFEGWETDFLVVHKLSENIATCLFCGGTFLICRPLN